MISFTARFSGLRGRQQKFSPPAPVTPVSNRLEGLEPRKGEAFAPPMTATALAERAAKAQAPSFNEVVEFGEWLPDLPEFANPGAIKATNVIPHVGSYRPFSALTTASQNALTARCLGGISAQSTGGSIFVYAGDATKLYEMVDGTFTDESGATYATAADDTWEGTVFNNKVIFTNYTNPVQFITIGGGGAGAFADLITSTLKPRARHLAVVRNFLVFGGTFDTTDGAVPNRVWWSGILDELDFDPDATTQCDYEDIHGGGRVQKIVGGEYGIVFMESQIVRMSYVGSPVVFRMDVVDRNRGTPIPNSVVSYGRNAFYISNDGFYAFDGINSTPIGATKVDKTFWNQFDITNKRGVSAVIDPVNKLVCWAFPGAGALGELPNKIYMYRWDVGKWAEADVDTELLLQTRTQGYTLDALDAAFGADIDDTGVYPISFDSDFYKGGGIQFGAFNQAHELAFFNGSNLAATIDTKEVQINGEGWATVTQIHPVVDADDLTAQIGGRARLGNTSSFDAAASLNSAGYCSVRNSNRYHRARINIASGDAWTHAQGVKLFGSPAGKR